jgi:hypothetical protein
MIKCSKNKQFVNFIGVGKFKELAYEKDGYSNDICAFNLSLIDIVAKLCLKKKPYGKMDTLKQIFKVSFFVRGVDYGDT